MSWVYPSSIVAPVNNLIDNINWIMPAIFEVIIKNGKPAVNSTPLISNNRVFGLNSTVEVWCTSNITGKGQLSLKTGFVYRIVQNKGTWTMLLQRVVHQKAISSACLKHLYSAWSTSIL